MSKGGLWLMGNLIQTYERYTSILNDEIGRLRLEIHKYDESKVFASDEVMGEWKNIVDEILIKSAM